MSFNLRRPLTLIAFVFLGFILYVIGALVFEYVRSPSLAQLRESYTQIIGSPPPLTSDPNADADRELILCGSLDADDCPKLSRHFTVPSEDVQQFIKKISDSAEKNGWQKIRGNLEKCAPTPEIWKIDCEFQYVYKNQILMIYWGPDSGLDDPITINFRARHSGYTIN